MSALDRNLGAEYRAAFNTHTLPRIQGRDNRAAALTQRDTNIANMDMAQWQYQAALEQWQRENEYNSPAAQMQRYMDAGLNPNLIYGQQNLSAGSPQPSAPTVQAPKMMNTRTQRAMAKLNAVTGAAQAIMSTLGEFQTLQQKAAQTDMVKANTKLILANAANADDVGILNGFAIQQAMANTFMKQFDWKHQGERYSLETEKTRQAIDNMRKQGQLMGEQLSLYGDGLTPQSSMLQHTLHGLFSGEQSFGWSSFGNIIIGLIDYIGKIFK